MLPTNCPSCRSIRQPNGSFCHMCGYSYVTKEAAATGAPASAAVAPSSRLTAGDGFKFGLGFMSAAVLFWLVFTLIFLGALGAIFGALFRALPR